MINTIYETVKSFVNTDGRGNFRPSDFNLFLYNSIQEKLDSYIIEINQLVNRENRGLINGGLENLPDILRQKLAHYLKTETIPKTGGIYLVPGDCKHFDTANTSTGDDLEFYNSINEFKITSRTVASAEFPIAIKIGPTIKTFPELTTPITLSYIRKPLFPKWTFVKLNGVEVFNPDAPDFQDADIHLSEEQDLIFMVCAKFGVNLKEPDLQTTMQSKENQEFNKQNAS